MTKSREDRLENLKVLMPSVPETVVLYLATENGLKPWNGSAERTAYFHNPLMDFFRKFRIDRKKLQRILHHCAAPAADDLKASFWRWEQESGQGEAHDMGSVAAVGRSAAMQDEGSGSVDDVTNAANDVITAKGTREPYLKLDPARCQLILRCDSALRRSGRYNGLKMERAHKLLRGLVRKCELDSKRRPPEYWVIPEYRRHYTDPHTVYADGKFGDGTEYYRVTDDNGKIIEQGRKPKVDPLVPEFLGLTLHEQNLLVAELYEKRRLEMQRKSQDEKNS